MSYDAREVANFILDVCENNGRKVSNLALQKIVYFCHVWSLIELGRPLVKHSFEAWEYGPVLPYLYREFKEFDRSPIVRRAIRLDPISGEKRIAVYDFEDSMKDFLNGIIGFYSQMRPGDLVELSHVAGGPWHKVWNHQGVVNPGMRISDAEIVQFYSKAPALFSVQ